MWYAFYSHLGFTLPINFCSRSSQAETNEAAPPAAGDIHLQVCQLLGKAWHTSNQGPKIGNAKLYLQVSKLRASDSDDRKFYLDTGTAEIRLKADTRCDATAW